MRIEFEKVTCTRCNGAGSFRAYSHVYGGACFRCGGAGSTLTKLGAAAQATYRQAMTITAAALEPGMIVIETDVSPGGDAIVTRKLAVEAVGPSDTRTTVDGVPVEYLDVTYKGGRRHGMSPTSPVQLGLSPTTRDIARAALEGVAGATVTN